MAEFTENKTQEELDRIINDRLKRERESTAKKFEGWISPDDQAKATADLQKQMDELTKSSAAQAKKYAGYDKDLAERDAKIKGYETASEKTKIALATGLPYDMASRLRGETAEDIQKDADALKAMMGTSKPAPLADTGDKVPTDSSKTALRDMLRSMKGE
jgi:membrane protein involved in colicin uptake